MLKATKEAFQRELAEKRLKQRATSIANKVVFPQITLQKYGRNFFLVDAVYVRDLVAAYIEGHKPPFEFKVDDGCLYANGDFLGRVVPAPSGAFDEKSYYAEGRILARQESDWD